MQLLLRAGLIFLALAGVVAPPSWPATNLGTNGGFEAGDFGAWRSFAVGAPDDSFDMRVAQSPGVAAEGTHLAVFSLSDLELLTAALGLAGAALRRRAQPGVTTPSATR